MGKIWIIILVVFCGLSNNIYGQSEKTTKSNYRSKNIDALQPAQFPGGPNALKKFLIDHIKYPSLARENNTQGSVLLSFLIDERGAVEDIRILRDIGSGCGNEAIRIAHDMPLWIPARYKGKPVKSLVEFPVEFKLIEM